MFMDWVRRSALAVILGIAPLIASAAAETPPGFTPPSAFSQQDRTLIKRLETYMNSVKTIRSQFVQVTHDGRYAKGDLAVERPGKVRFEYAPPTPILIVANYGWVNYMDTKLETVSKVPVSATPLEILIGETIRFSGDVTVTGMQRGPGSVRIAVVQTDEPDEGMVVLTFGIDPDVTLRKWSIVDPQGMNINIALFNAQMNTQIDEELFEFRNPNFFR